MKGAQSQNQMQGSNPYGSGGIPTGTYTQQNQGLYTGSPQGQGFQGQGQGFNGMQGPMGLGSSQTNPGNPALGGGMRSGPMTNGNSLQFGGSQPSYLFQPPQMPSQPLGNTSFGAGATGIGQNMNMHNGG